MNLTTVENFCHVYLNRRPRRKILANLHKRPGYDFQVVRLTTLYCNFKSCSIVLIKCLELNFQNRVYYMTFFHLVYISSNI